MPLSKERMREYMKEYRLKNPEYEEKINSNYKKKYHSDPEYREKRKEYFISYNNKKKDINNIEIIA